MINIETDFTMLRIYIIVLSTYYYCAQAVLLSNQFRFSYVCGIHVFFME
jgi:hypothetical protein